MDLSSALWYGFLDLNLWHVFIIFLGILFISLVIAYKSLTSPTMFICVFVFCFWGFFIRDDEIKINNPFSTNDKYAKKIAKKENECVAGLYFEYRKRDTIGNVFEIENYITNYTLDKVKQDIKENPKLCIPYALKKPKKKGANK